MSSPYGHLSEATAQLLDLPDAQRIRSIFVERFIYHEQVIDLIKHSEHLMYKPRGVRPKGLSERCGKNCVGGSVDAEMCDA